MLRCTPADAPQPQAARQAALDAHAVADVASLTAELAYEARVPRPSFPRALLTL